MSLNDVWDGAAGSPFYPLVSKDSQFFVGFSLLLVGESQSSANVGGVKLTQGSVGSDRPLWTE